MDGGGVSSGDEIVVFIVVVVVVVVAEVAYLCWHCGDGGAGDSLCKGGRC